jgi:hypothetical protein
VTIEQVGGLALTSPRTYEVLMQGWRVKFRVGRIDGSAS